VRSSQRTGLAEVRSLLFAPGNDERKLRGALSSEADAVIADLEDAVPGDQKDAARDTVENVFGEPRASGIRCLRIGALDSDAVAADLRVAERIDVDVLIVPKATPEGLRRLPGTRPIVAIVETPAGLQAAHEVAAAPRVRALMLGLVDLSAALGLVARDDGLELLHARSTLVLASAAAGLLAPFDGPRVNFTDEARLESEVALVRALGFGGKACIHPLQVPAVNRGFTPSDEELEWARRVVTALDSARATGRGAVALGHTMIDEPVAARARTLLARA